MITQFAWPRLSDAPQAADMLGIAQTEVGPLPDGVSARGYIDDDAEQTMIALWDGGPNVEHIIADVGDEPGFLAAKIRIACKQLVGRRARSASVVNFPLLKRMR